MDIHNITSKIILIALLDLIIKNNMKNSYIKYIFFFKKKKLTLSFNDEKSLIVSYDAIIDDINTDVVFNELENFFRKDLIFTVIYNIPKKYIYFRFEQINDAKNKTFFINAENIVFYNTNNNIFQNIIKNINWKIYNTKNSLNNIFKLKY